MCNDISPRIAPNKQPVQPALLRSAGIDPRADAVRNNVNLAHNITPPQLTFTQTSIHPKG